MNYYFDVKLNFLDKFYNYYEWDAKDNVVDVKKIPIIKVSFSDYINIYTNKVKVDNDFLEKIKNKTASKDNIFEYVAILTDSNNSVAILFNKLGESILYSSLRYSDEVNIEEISYKLKKEKINFINLEPIVQSKKVRFENIIKKNVLEEISNLINVKKYSKLKYIYNEVFKTNEKEMKIIIDKFKQLKDNEIIDIYEILNCNKIN